MTYISNPFNITFGKEPNSIISRDNDINQIRESFLNKYSDSQVYIINGPRGSGKTVSLTTLSNEFKQLSDWLVIEINPEYEILEQLAAKIYDEGKLRKLFIKSEFNFSFKGIGFTISGNNPISNVSSLLKKEFEYLKKKNFKVLITIDEISSNNYVKIFAHEFQLFIRNNYDVFLLMTGLYQNIASLQKEETLTFLKRAPRITLSDLNIKSIINSYKNIFKINQQKSTELAKITEGYPFAYQLLGDILYKNKTTTITDEIIDEFDELIQERAYSLIYEELSPLEKEIIKSAAIDDKNLSILKKLEISKSQLSNYKKNLTNKGILSPNSRDRFIFKLPRFKEYVLLMISLE